MNKPSELIRKAKGNHSAKRKEERDAEQTTQKPLPAQPCGHRGAYAQLMRSHDRVHTRHLH